MDRVAPLETLVERIVADYADSDCWECRLIFSADYERHIYSVLMIPDTPRPFPAQIVVMARVVGEKVVIEDDISFNRPLHEALMQAGIPRAQIILVYAGEALPEG